MDQYAVIGNPVAHSLSPEIHAEFARQTGQTLAYERLLAPLDGFVPAAAAFFARGGCGLNVTVPFKFEAARWVHELDDAAAIAGAVNTIVPLPRDRSVSSGRRYRGFNTDGAGLLKDLATNHGIVVAGSRVLVIGAGGAVHGVLQPLVDAAPQSLVVANRTAARAQALVSGALSRAGRVVLSASDLQSLAGPFDLVINGTSAGLEGSGDLVPAGVAAGAFCYDMVYGRDTPFCRWAREHGAAGAADGLGMLVEQAALAFELWRGLLPETAPVLARLRERLRQPPEGDD